MTYAFKQAEPVAITGTGAKKADNPFTAAVESIAWRNHPTTGKPEALSFTEEHDGTEKNVDQIKNKIRRLMKDAGDSLKTPGTVRTAFELIGKDTLKITFWVVKLQERPRKKTAETAS